MFPNNFYNNNMFYHPYYPNFPMPVPEEGRSESPSSASDNAGPSSTSTSKQSTSNGSTRWTSEQTATLVALWKENHEKLESAENKTTWDKIVLEVNQFPEKKTLKQCKDKIRNLKQQYKDAKHQNKQTGNSPTTSAFYEDFDEALGNRPVITMPGVKRFGQNTSTDNCSDQAAGDQSDSNHGLRGQPQGSGKVNSGSKGKGPLKQSPPKKSPLKKSPSKRRRSTGGKADTEDGGFKAQLLELQQKQVELFKESEQRQEQLLLKLDENQRKAEADAREQDQATMLKLAELFMKNK